MLTKQKLKSDFAKDWKKQYEVELFAEKGFTRKTCPKCGKNFWTLDGERELCGDPPCETYGFINNTITCGKWDYIETWRMFEKFFKKDGHTSIPRYPVVDRWRPDLFFTMASIQDFQRIEKGNMVFQYPANPLIVPQVCLRFNDIPNVGVTGRHLTSFIMSGQHAFNKPGEGYFKDRCIDLNFKFLNSVMGIPETELTYIEDVWAMPDFSAFGPNLETMSRGLELVNSVFMQFQAIGTGANYKELPMRVIDVGWGHERLVWFSNGTPASYDCLFGPVTERMKKGSGIEIDPGVFDKYSVMAGNLDLDSVSDIESAKRNIANQIGVSAEELKKIVEPMQALYAVADHTRSLLFAIADGGIPSNVGGGYNLRIILRRALGFINEYDFDFSLTDIAEQHTRYLKPMFPELSASIDDMEKIIGIEAERYEKTRVSAHKVVLKELSKTSHFSDDHLAKLYESQGITPELVEEVASEAGMDVEVPGDFYVRLTDKHQFAKKEEEKIGVDVSGIQKTEILYYDNPEMLEFDAKVLNVIDGWAILDMTLFYAEGGGQASDIGTLGGANVTDVQRIGDVVLHKVDKPIAGAQMSDGHSAPRSDSHIRGAVHGKIDPDRRTILSQMHTGIHIINAAARQVLGKHVWQNSAAKTPEKARIDITHYSAITGQEEKAIEKRANEIVKENHPVRSFFMGRGQAEEKYGFTIYQGGGPAGSSLRIIEIPGIDVEACGGTHVKTTGEVGEIRIMKTERIQDGAVRIEIVTGAQVAAFKDKNRTIFEESAKVLGSELEYSEDDLKRAADVFSVPAEQLTGTIGRFCKEYETCRRLIGESGTKFEPGEGEEKTLALSCRILFDKWKGARKEAERVRSNAGENLLSDLGEKFKSSPTVKEITRDMTIKAMTDLANKITEPDGRLLVLVNVAGEKVNVVVASSDKNKNAGEITKELCGKLGGGGGGSPKLGMGGGLADGAEKVLNGLEV